MWSITVIALLVAAPAGVTTATLLEEMRDLDRLTEPAAYTCRQFSSYDRASHRPEGWFANDDRGHYLRKEGGELVMAEAFGPGAIVRIWSANPEGRIRIRLDGEVALDADMRKLLSGEVKPFVPPFGAMRSRGANLYFPFPYAKSMKVTCDRPGLYYHVNVRTYAKGTDVETFSIDRPLPPLPALEAAPSGKTTLDRRIDGAGVVRWLEVDLPEDPRALREKTLRIRVDGETTVLAPLGDFFGTAPGRTAYRSLPLGITKEGKGTCAFPMPFERSFLVDVDAPARVRFTRDRRSLRFHAWWRGSNAVATRPMSDWPVLRARGRGRYVGTALAVRNPVKAWWGEGDEKVFVDGEPFPSTFGTGTEDYFGYAWCDPTPFEAPYHNQTRCDGPANRGQTALARFHVLDDVPFERSIRFLLEVWHWADVTIGLSSVAYWYAEPGATHDFPEPAPEDRAIVPLPDRAVKGAIEGESLAVLAKTGGVAEPQDLSWAEGFSGDAHLWWRGARPKDVLRVRFDSEVEGERALVLALTTAPDYGIVKLAVNGRVLAARLDLWAERVAALGERSFERVPLKKGPNELLVEIVGTNEKAHPKNYMFGLDYLRIPER